MNKLQSADIGAGLTSQGRVDFASVIFDFKKESEHWPLEMKVQYINVNIFKKVKGKKGNDEVMDFNV